MPEFRRAAALACLLLAACAGRGPVPRSPSPPPAPATAAADAVDAAAAERILVLVSLDGFHPRHLAPATTPALARIAREGARAAWMRPSYPSLTFPNHYTLVTGLRPDRHGLVHNWMHDPALGDYRPALREAVGDGRWYGGEPLWVGAARAGLRTATMFWPGSEAAIGGVRPDHWRPYDPAMPSAARVDAVLAWLRAPPPERPRLATLYLDEVDIAGHAHGADSPAALAAVRAVDAALARLLDGIAAAGLDDAVDLVVVSDHGMATVPAGQAIAIEDMADPSDAGAVTRGQVVQFAPRPGREAAAERRLLGRHPHYACWRKGELPARWHYGAHPRIPAIVCQMDEGWDALPRRVLAQRNGDHARGSHGYDPSRPSMRALFVARGPSFRRGARVPAFDNVDVYPLLAHLLGIAPAANDGDLDSLRPLLAEPRSD